VIAESDPVRGIDSTEELRRAAAAIRWYHTMDLGQGVRTEGSYDPGTKLDRYRIPPDLSGKSVLDVGAFNGFFSFEAERRGAARVLATDSFAWTNDNWNRDEGFQLARRALDSRVEARLIDALDLSPETVGTFDVVFFLGILYHMKHPMLALERVASVCDELLILETHVDLVNIRRPAIAFYPGRELNDDWTNWCGPNPAAVIGMLRNVGFSNVEILPPASRLYNVPKYFVNRALKRGHRMFFHAHR
jgi:tRNA (mo5U34)-methyltransferase